MQRGPIEQLKVAVIGDGTVGKTSLLYSFSSNVFPGEYLPTYDTDHFAAIVTFNGEHYRLLLWDSPGQDELFAPVSPLLFQQVDVILVCYAIDSPASLHNAKYRWVPELKRRTPDTPIIIVGTKSDLRPARRHPLPNNVYSSALCTTHTPIRLTPWSPPSAGGRSPRDLTSGTKPSSSSSRSFTSSRKVSVQSPSRAKPPSSISPRHASSTSHHFNSEHRSCLEPAAMPTSEETTNPATTASTITSFPASPSRPSLTHVIEYTEGLQLAREVGASAYVECSALVKSGMDGVFQETCAAYCLKHDKLHKSAAVRSSMRWRSRNLGYRPSFRRAL